jgi:hypothetical protein
VSGGTVENDGHHHLVYRPKCLTVLNDEKDDDDHHHHLLFIFFFHFSSMAQLFFRIENKRNAQRTPENEKGSEAETNREEDGRQIPCIA